MVLLIDMSKKFEEIESDRLLYASSYFVAKTIGRILLGFKVSGQENIPDQGRAIIAANHRHWLDIFLLPTAVPDRHLTIVAKKELYEIPVMGVLFRRWGTISVDRENPGTETMRQVRQTLNDDRLVAVLPEGHRDRKSELGPMHAGVARWARLGRAITVPAAIRGVDSFSEAFLHRSAEVIFGEPLDPPQSRNDESEFMSHLRGTIQTLYES